jgi:hypothetical protein
LTTSRKWGKLVISDFCNYIRVKGERTLNQNKATILHRRSYVTLHSNHTHFLPRSQLGRHRTPWIISTYRSRRYTSGTFPSGTMPPKLPSASQTPAASSLASKKRKSSPQPKFYGVRSGHKPGVYLNWKDCEKNITGFKGASCKDVNLCV